MNGFPEEEISNLRRINSVVQLCGIDSSRERPSRHTPFSIYLRYLAELEKALLRLWNLRRNSSARNEVVLCETWLDGEFSRKSHLFKARGELNGLYSALSQRMPVAKEEDLGEKTLFYVLGDATTSGHFPLDGLGKDHSTECAFFQMLRDFEKSGAWSKLVDFLPETHRRWAGALPENIGFSGTGFVLPAWQKAWEEFSVAEDWGALGNTLRKFRNRSSGGEFAFHSAFRFVPEKSNGLEPVKNPRKVDFADLSGIDKQREALIGNAKNLFSQGFAHHVLLWGHRGTGKSSSVLALLNEMADEGLKLVEVPRTEAGNLAGLFEKLAGLPEKFIVYLDDLGFESMEPAFALLKTSMDGGIHRPEQNLIVVATSNRKSFLEHESAQTFDFSGKRKNDETRALDDRFALKLFFDVKQFDELKKIFFELAGKRRLSANPETLFPEFQRFCFENQHDSPSCRNIEQFLGTVETPPKENDGRNSGR